MISNFSEVEKSLKRCLKEKVSITAATVVGFLIAGTVAFGGEPTNVTFTTKSEGKVTVQVGSGGVNDVNGATNFISVGQYETLLGEGEGKNEELAKLLTVETDENGVTTFASAVNEGGDTPLGTVKATATTDGALTLIKTEKDYKSIISELTIEATGFDADNTATAMEATNSGDKVTNAGEITVNEHAVGMVAGAGATAVNNAKTDKTAGITVNADAGEANTAIGMLADGDKATATNNGKIDAQKGIGMLAKNGATIENSAGATIEAGNEDTSAGTGMLVTENGTATNNGTINVNYTGSIGMSTTTVADSTTTLTNNGTIDVKAGTGISVAGAGGAKVTFGAAGKIEVVDARGNIGININGTAKTSNTTITGGTIELKGAGTGINAKGNVTLKDIAITLSDGATGTGIVYAGGDTEAEAEISTRDIDIKAAGKGIEATMSKVAKSTLNITTGIISTVEGATGIKITGTELEELSDGETPTTATVTTTLGKTKGTGVEVTGKANNIINVTLQDTQTPTSKTPISIAKGIDVTSNGEGGIINIDVKQSNLQVTGTGNLVNIGAVGGTTNVDINQNVELVGTGNLVNVGAITGTTNVNINKDIKVATEGTGNIVKAGAITGTLNINLNVGDKNTTSKSLNVAEGNTALNLANVSDGTTFVKNTGNVTIEGNGTLVKGNDTNTISLSNQGLINVSTVDTSNKEKSSHISSGEKVNVANYGTIDLSSSGITVEEFIENAGETAKEKTALDQLTIDEVKTALKTLGVINTGAEGTFSSVGYIRFKNGELFTTAKALSGSQTVEGLSSALNQEGSDRAFAIAKDGNFTLNSAGENEKLENVQFSLDGTMKISGTAATPVNIDNSNVERQVYITGNGKLEVENNAILNYSGNISADNINTAEAAIAITDTGTLTLANGALNMVAPESKTALLSEPANRVGIELTGAGTTELDNYTVNADIKGKLDGSNLQGTLSAKGKSRITGNVTDISKIEVTDNGMLTFGADSKIESGATSGTTATTIDLANGNMGVEIGEKGKNVLYNTTVGDIAFNNLVANTPQDAKSGKIVLLTNALTENTEFNLGKHKLEQGAVVANGDIYYNITQGNGGIWNAIFNKDGLIDKTGYKYMELNDMYVATQ
ncbi:autotransporter domain-containing protein, partial [Fusobacterium varium]|uniref:beta strand repeat-containing protein n=1 Tax=Fusobacterium varium TaxID=856 RepID=UPI002FE46290